MGMAGELMTAGEGGDEEMDGWGFVAVKSLVGGRLAIGGDGLVSSGIRVFGGPTDKIIFQLCSHSQKKYFQLLYSRNFTIIKSK